MFNLSFGLVTNFRQNTVWNSPIAGVLRLFGHEYTCPPHRCGHGSKPITIVGRIIMLCGYLPIYQGIDLSPCVCKTLVIGIWVNINSMHRLYIYIYIYVYMYIWLYMCVCVYHMIYYCANETLTLLLKCHDWQGPSQSPTDCWSTFQGSKVSAFYCRVSIAFTYFCSFHMHYIPIIEGSLEVKLPTVWTDEKHSQEEAQAWRKSEGRR